MFTEYVPETLIIEYNSFVSKGRTGHAPNVKIILYGVLDIHLVTLAGQTEETLKN